MGSGIVLALADLDHMAGLNGLESDQGLGDERFNITDIV
jgi:hypothetical protein